MQGKKGQYIFGICKVSERGTYSESRAETA